MGCFYTFLFTVYTVDSFNIRYDDKNEQVLSFPVGKSAGPNEFCMKIGPLKIKLGHHYSAWY